MNKTIIYVLGIAVLVVAVVLLWPRIFTQSEYGRSPIPSVLPTPAVFSVSPGAGVVSPQAWKTYSDTAKGILFQYPPSFGTQYMHELDWPPQVQVLQEPYQCTEGGSSTARAGETKQKTVNGHQYCVTVETEGAAGSIYYQYAYAAPLGSKTAIFTFSVRAVQCANYDEPNKTACEQERASFNVDAVMDQVMQTAKVQ